MHGTRTASLLKLFSENIPSASPAGSYLIFVLERSAINVPAYFSFNTLFSRSLLNCSEIWEVSLLQ